MAIPSLGRFPRNAVAITESDTTKFNFPTTVYVGVTGDVAVVTWDNEATVTFVGVPAGACLPVEVSQVLAASTAASLVGMWE